MSAAHYSRAFQCLLEPCDSRQVRKLASSLFAGELLEPGFLHLDLRRTWCRHDHEIIQVWNVQNLGINAVGVVVLGHLVVVRSAGFTDDKRVTGAIEVMERGEAFRERALRAEGKSGSRQHGVA